MSEKKLGSQTICFPSKPVVLNWAAVTGPREGEGPYGDYFDMVSPDPLLGQESWEKAEQRLMQYSMELALEKQKWLPDDLDVFMGGDLMNQIISANFTARELGVPFLGLYGACSTLAEGMALASMMLDGGYAKKVGVSAVSHHNSAEKQYRFPTEMGTQRPMTAQWTVTGGGSYLLASEGGDERSWRVAMATIGKVNDLGIQNSNDMGSAMAPAAFDTIKAHFVDTGRRPEDYDAIITGDLGKVGHEVLIDFLKQDNLSGQVFTDCGLFVYNEKQDAHSGASGCGCSAVILGPVFLDRRNEKPINRVLFVGTGALLSPTTAFQGETVPGIAHAVCLERGTAICG